MWVKSILFCKKITFVTRFLPYDVLATWQIVISYIREVEKEPGLWEIQEVHLVFPGSLANPIFQFLHSSLKIVYLIKTIFVPRYTRPSFSGYFNICTSLKGHLMCYWYASLSLFYYIYVSSRCTEDLPCLRSHSFMVFKKKKFSEKMFPICGISYAVSSDQHTHFTGQVI